ncbi:rare lipoprotein A [Pustulibacterium marinum]|uniref:Probable endolytic peptidoglycan transglycosylase RlpA n=1 Tax=Pustulibacterium marinum TaxID=1224947 RepID=A0A1I7H5J3_9FLAO|nr:septal ring lytic transglycosylase RlpA family protein [Pustulibacterium marinum]SFU55931.1 rare lipoprotein A [Pustulibacterium marinum]
MKFFAIISVLFFSLSLSAQVQTGKASFYGDKFEGKLTASGEKYKHSKATAAHRALPFGTKLKVTNLANNKSAVVEVNDRGPFSAGRIIDVSKSVAEKLDFVNAGVADVIIEVIDDSEIVAETNVVVLDEISGETAQKVVEEPVQEQLESNSIVETEFYELSISRVSPNWIGVQIGSFQEMANLIRLADNLKVNYQKEITVQVKTVAGVKVYSLILGKFTNRKKAENFRDHVQKKYPDSFIIDMTAE